MAAQRKYNIWKTGIILKIKKIDNLEKFPKFPWSVVAISKIIKEKYGQEIVVKTFGYYESFEAAKEAVPLIQKTIKKYKFPR